MPNKPLLSSILLISLFVLKQLPSEAQDLNHSILLSPFLRAANANTISISKANPIDYNALSLIAPPECHWAYLIGTSPHTPDIFDIVIDPSGNIIVCGSYTGTLRIGSFRLFTVSYYGCYLAKLTIEGDCLWLKEMSEINGWLSLSTDSFGNIYVGESRGVGNAIVKLDANGNPLWTKPLNSAAGSIISCIAADAIGNCYVSGDFYHTWTLDGFSLTAFGDCDIYVLKLNPSGHVEWIKQGGSVTQDSEDLGFYECSPPEIRVDASNNLLLNGDPGTLGGIQFETVSNIVHDYIIKYDANGNLLWTGPDANLSYFSLSCDAMSNIYILGYFQGDIILGSYNLTSNDATHYDILFAKFSSSGEVTWAKKFSSIGASIDDYATAAVATDPNGYSIIIGKSGDVMDIGGMNVNGYFVAKFDEGGGLCWAIDSEIFKMVNHTLIYSDCILFCGSFQTTIEFGHFRLSSADPSSDNYLADYKEVSYRDTQPAILNSDLVFNGGAKPGDGHSVSMHLTAMSGSGQIFVSQLNNAPAGAPSSQALGVYWSIQTDAGLSSLTGNLTFHYTNADVTGLLEDAAHLGLAFFDSTSQTWAWLGGTIDALDNTITVTGISHFSRFGLFGTIFGDVNQDGYVDGADLQRLGDCWHETYGGEFAAGSDGRFYNYNKNTNNENCQIIDAADLQMFGDCWHNGTP